jgi:hypothetical protein
MSDFRSARSLAVGGQVGIVSDLPMCPRENRQTSITLVFQITFVIFFIFSLTIGIERSMREKIAHKG